MKTPNATESAAVPPISAAQRERMIAEAAYFRAEHRGFQPGDPVADWIEAEAEIDRLLEGRSAAGLESSREEKGAWEERLEAQLRQLERTLRSFTESTRKVRGRTRAEMEGVLRSLSERQAKARTKLAEFHESSEVAWDDLRIGAEKAWNDLRLAIDAARSRFVQAKDKER